jgi:hypothetical protein
MSDMIAGASAKVFRGFLRCKHHGLSNPASGSRGFEQLTDRAVGIVHVRPDALVHFDDPIVRGDKPDAKLMFDGGAQEQTIDLYRSELRHWPTLVRGLGEELVQTAPYVHDVVRHPSKLKSS